VKRSRGTTTGCDQSGHCSRELMEGDSDRNSPFQ
jgi:hypothetical protein